MKIEQVRDIIKKRNPHRAIKCLMSYQTDQYHTRYICYFKNGDYATYWTWANNEDRLTGQMDHGRWLNRKTGKEIKLTFYV